MLSLDSEVARFEVQHPNQEPVEVVIVNDGCQKPELIGVLAQLARRPRYRVIHLPKNLGVAGALAVGVTACAYGLIARFDADDVMLPGRLSAQFAAMSADAELAVIGSSVRYYAQSADGIWRANQPIQQPTIVDRHVALQSYWFINHPTVMYRKFAVLQVGSYDPTLRGQSEDFDLWVRMIRVGAKIRNLSEPYHLLRLSPASASRNFNASNNAFLQERQASLM